MTTPTRAKPSRLRSSTFEFRAAGGDANHGDGRTLEGYAAVFDVATEIDSWEGTFNEVIARGAFKRTLNARMPVMQFDHGHDARTGTVPIGAFATLAEDETGLFVSGRLFDNPVVEPIRQAIDGKAITGMSFRFRVVNDAWTDREGKKIDGDELFDLLWMPGERGPLTRTIKEVELFEAGPVVFPAYEATTVGVRSQIANMPRTEREALMRDLAQELRQPDEPDPAEVTSPQADEPQPEPAEGEGQHDQEPAESGTSATPPDDDQREENIVDTDSPMTVAERTDRQSAIRTRLTEIDTQFSGGSLPDDIEREWSDLNDELDEHTVAIDAAEARRARLAELADDGNGERSHARETSRRAAGTRGRGTVPPRQRQDDIYDILELRRRASSLDEMPVLMRDNALRAIEEASYPGVEDRSAAQTRAERLLRKLDDKEGTLARRILTTGSPLYKRAFGKMVSNMSTDLLSNEERAGLAYGSDGTKGAFAVPFDLDPTVILTSDGVINPLRSMARVEQITGKEWDGVTSDGVVVSRGAENTETTDNSPTLAQPTVKAVRVQGFVPFSIEMDQDWSSLQAEITMMLQDAKDTEEATSFVTGDGTGTNAGGVIGTLDAGSNVVTHGDVDGAASFTVDDVYKLKNALVPRFRARGQFLGETAIYDEVRQFDENGGSNLWVQLQSDRPANLIGYPAREISTMASAVANDAKILLFGDFRQFLIVDRIGMNIELIPHLFGTARNYPTGQRGIFAVWRNNSKILTSKAFRLLVVNGASGT